MRGQSKVRTITEEVVELFLEYGRTYESAIFLDFIFRSGSHIRGKHRHSSTPPPRERWRHTPEIMTFLLYCMRFSEEEIGFFSSPKSSPGISQQAVSKRLDLAEHIVRERFGADLHEASEKIVQSGLARGRIELFALVADYIAGLQKKGTGSPEEPAAMRNAGRPADDVAMMEGMVEFLEKKIEERRRQRR